MILEDLVSYFRANGSFEEFCKIQNLNIESEVIEIYMQESLSLNGKLYFFEIEKSEGKIKFIFNGIEYINLFDFFYFLDTIEEFNNAEYLHIKDVEIANILLNYVINDG